jgi:hypothetical protein
VKKVTFLSTSTRVKGILECGILTFLQSENEGALQEEEDIKTEV